MGEHYWCGGSQKIELARFPSLGEMGGGIVTKGKRANAVRRGRVEQCSRAGTPTERAWAPYGQSIRQLDSCVLVMQFVNYLDSAQSWAKPAHWKTLLGINRS